MSEEKKCRHCAMMIPKEAKVCPHCRKKQGINKLVIIIPLFLLAIWWMMPASFDSYRERAKNNPTPAVAPTQAKPVLELQQWNWHEEHGYAIAEGAIKNISSESLDNVVAVMLIYDKNGNFIKSDDALIEYRPILPGQTSPFKVMSSFNPEMNKATINFKAFSGGTLSWRKKNEDKNE